MQLAAYKEITVVLFDVISTDKTCLMSLVESPMKRKVS